MRIGERVIAVRKEASRTGQNTVMGIVIEIWENDCAVELLINDRQRMSVKLNFEDWTFLEGL